MKVYFIKIALRGVSPMVCRRLSVPGTASLAMLHDSIQIINGWDDTHLNQFRIFGKDYGVYHDGGISFNDDARWRYGEAISTGFVESTINEVVAKRMVKKQQMQWTQEDAHYMIQTRTAVLNDELHKNFGRWYPGFSVETKPLKMGKVA